MIKPAYTSLRGDSARAKISSDVVIVGELVLISGVLPIDLDDDRILLPELVEDQTQKILANVRRILASVGLNKTNVVAVTVHTTNLKKFFDRINSVYSKHFDSACLPVCSWLGVSELRRGALIEMNFIAAGNANR